MEEQDLIDRKQFEETDLTGLFNEIVQRMDRLADCMVELEMRLEAVEDEYGIELYSCPVCYDNFETKQKMMSHISSSSGYHGANNFVPPGIREKIEDSDEESAEGEQ